MAFSVCVNLKKDPNTSNYYVPDKSASTATTTATTYIDRRRCATSTIPSTSTRNSKNSRFKDPIPELVN